MDELKTITREKLRAKMERGEDLVLLEALGEASYQRAHLPGAIRFKDTSKAPEVLPDNSALIVAYCSSFD